MFADLIIAVIFIGILAGILVCSADKIGDWAETTRYENLHWRK